jgi:hypothetical protein
MSIEVIVRDDIEHYSVVVATAPGSTADRFRRKFQFSDENPCFLNDYLDGPRRDNEKLWEYKRLCDRFPDGWQILGCLWASKYELMDWLVEEFDADVDWPEYQHALQQLRKRREQLRTWRAQRPDRAYRGVPTPRRYPERVVAAYAVIGCSPGASLGEVHRAYKKLCRQHHPDAGGSHAAMTRLNKAMEVLRAFHAAVPLRAH